MPELLTLNSRPSILVLNGPNLNLLGTREPHLYGHQTLADLEAMLLAQAQTYSPAMALRFVQSNYEGQLIEALHQARPEGSHPAEGVIFNPGGLTHTSVALADAVLSYAGPVIEVHLSNPHAREAFRHHSYISPVAKGVITGLGVTGYGLALDALHSLLNIPSAT